MRVGAGRALVALGACLIVQAAVPGAAASGQARPSAESISVAGGRLTVRAAESPLDDVLGAIGRRSGVRVVLHTVIDERITVVLRDSPLDEGLRRMLRDRSSVFVYAGPASTRAGAPAASLSEVHVYERRRDARESPGAPVRSLPAAPPGIRTRSARRPGTLERHGVVDVLRHALYDDDASAREALVKALGRTRSPDAVAPLAAAVTSDPDPYVREAAVEALSKSWSESAVEPLVQALFQDRRGFVREAAARGLGMTWSAAAVDPLVRALSEDRRARVRETAADALGVLGNVEAIAPLERSLDDESPAVRERAARALHAIWGQ